jgi:hypothetical protein
VTEASLAAGFTSWLGDHSRNNGIPVFREVFGEVECRQGIPDIIGLSCDWRPSSFPSFRGNCGVSLSAASDILALFNNRDCHTTEYLTSHSGLSKDLARQTINALCELGLASRTPKGSVKLRVDLSWLESDMWAFELKLHDWRRALFQTLQYRAFASYEVLVMPSEKRNVISRQLRLFESAGVGVVLFDPMTSTGETLLKAKRNRPTLMQHKVFAMCRLLQDYCEGTKGYAGDIGDS